MAKTTFTAEQKAEALRLYADLGPSEAARRTGIAKGTISSWAGRTQTQTVATANTVQATEQARVSWAARKAKIIDDFGALAEECIAKARQTAEAGEKGYKDLAVTAAIAVDKAQLLSGGPTARLDVTKPEERVQEAATLRQQLEQARTANGKPAVAS